jgi:hypothetical protein
MLSIYCLAAAFGFSRHSAAVESNVQPKEAEDSSHSLNS